jgi:hypothetical protein
VEIQLIAGSGPGMLNPINLRENGWTADAWLEVKEQIGSSYKVELPSGECLWVKGRDIRSKR